MIEVGAFEAKTKLSSLLEKVSQGPEKSVESRPRQSLTTCDATYLELAIRHGIPSADFYLSV